MLQFIGLVWDNFTETHGCIRLYHIFAFYHWSNQWVSHSCPFHPTNWEWFPSSDHGLVMLRSGCTSRNSHSGGQVDQFCAGERQFMGQGGSSKFAPCPDPTGVSLPKMGNSPGSSRIPLDDLKIGPENHWGPWNWRMGICWVNQKNGYASPSQLSKWISQKKSIR